MDILMNYETAKELVNSIGWDGFMQKMNDKYGRNFYSISKDWYENKQYICKLKGARGDLIINWE